MRPKCRRNSWSAAYRRLQARAARSNRLAPCSQPDTSRGICRGGPVLPGGRKLSRYRMDLGSGTRSPVWKPDPSKFLSITASAGTGAGDSAVANFSNAGLSAAGRQFVSFLGHRVREKLSGSANLCAEAHGYLREFVICLTGAGHQLPCKNYLPANRISVQRPRSKPLWLRSKHLAAMAHSVPSIRRGHTGRCPRGLKARLEKEHHQ